MTTALIGHTGFVGSNLAAQTRFNDCYNSQNIEEMAGKDYDLIVCCGARAEKWLANLHPESDRQGIKRLTDVLDQVRAKQMILISTVDVFQSPINVDENSPIMLDGLGPYGKHRFELEQFVRMRFPTLIVRLPGLFGPGLKKNIIYDFLNDNAVDKIHHAACYQFYDTTRLWRDIQVALKARLNLVHFATEPVSVADVARIAFGREFTNAPHDNPARYDFRTRHDSLYGNTSGYLYSHDEVLHAIRQFAQTHPQRRAA